MIGLCALGVLLALVGGARALPPADLPSAAGLLPAWHPPDTALRPGAAADGAGRSPDLHYLFARPAGRCGQDYEFAASWTFADLLYKVPCCS